jgi:predicted phosphodiesterase
MGDNDMNGVKEDDYGYGLENNDELQALLRSQEYRFVICGHTHRRMVRDFGGVTVINVGTLLGSDDPCFAWIDFGAGQVLFYAITSEGDIREAARHAL